MPDSDTLVIKSFTVNSGTVDVAVYKISLYEEEKDKKNAAFGLISCKNLTLFLWDNGRLVSII